MSGGSRWQRIHAVVRRIPAGRVATYGQVAHEAGLGPHARQVGYALHALREGDDVPWQRVVNARGSVSPRSEPAAESLQRALLEAEGVAFDQRGRVDLERYGWRPAGAGARTGAGADARVGSGGGETGSRRRSPGGRRTPRASGTTEGKA